MVELERRKILMGSGIALLALLVIGGVWFSQNKSIFSISESPEYKLLKIHGEATGLYNQEYLLWQSWTGGNITTKEFYDGTKPVVEKLNSLVLQINATTVPEEWEEAYGNYGAYLVMLRDAFSLMYAYAVEKEKNNLSPDDEAFVGQRISQYMQEANNYFQTSWGSWPVMPQFLSPPSLRPFPPSPIQGGG
ncbi:MAG: hypothetical protein HYU02_00860 [Thaumarchaeota archaeon]|nr:hypothetical protein [Nitrososphaerota archaeon]